MVARGSRQAEPLGTLPSFGRLCFPSRHYLAGFQGRDCQQARHESLRQRGIERPAPNIEYCCSWDRHVRRSPWHAERLRRRLGEGGLVGRPPPPGDV